MPGFLELHSDWADNVFIIADQVQIYGNQRQVIEVEENQLQCALKKDRRLQRQALQDLESSNLGLDPIGRPGYQRLYASQTPVCQLGGLELGTADLTLALNRIFLGQISRPELDSSNGSPQGTENPSAFVNNQLQRRNSI